MRRWIPIALAASVALNLFFSGIAVARFWQHQKWRSERRGDASAQSAGASGGPARPDARRNRRRGRSNPLAWMTEAERGELRSKRQALVGTRRDAEQVLSLEPFDVGKFRSTLQQLRAETTQIQASVHERLVQHAEALGPEERRKLANASWGTPGERGAAPPRNKD